MVETIQYTSSGLKIIGEFYSTGETAPLPTLVYLSGFPGLKLDSLDVAKNLCKHGINVMTFNFRGGHLSEGEWNFDNTQEDIRATLDFLRQPDVAARLHIDSDKLLLGGYSFGGGMAITFACHNDDIKSVFTISGPNYHEFMREYAENESYKTMTDDYISSLKAPDSQLTFSVNSTPIEIHENGISMSKFDHKTHSDGLIRKNVLFIGGWDDLNVKLERHLIPVYRKMKTKGSENAKFVAFQDDHSFQNSLEELYTVIIDWIRSIYPVN